MKIGKKILSILTILFSLYGISFGYSLIDNCSGIPNDGLSENTMYNEYTKCIEFNPGEDFIFRSNYTNSVSSNFNFTYYGTLDYKTLYTYGSYNGNGIHFMYWNSLGNLIGVSDTTYYNRVANFQINNFCYYGGSDYTGAYQKCANGLKIHDPCMNNNYNVSFSDFVSGVENHVLEKFYLMYFDYGYYIEEYGPILCGKYDNGFYCINNNFRQEYSNDLCSGITLIEDNQTNVGNGLNFYSSEFSNSPINGGGSGGGGQGIPVINVSCPTIQQLINSYPEQYNTTLCYSSEKIWSGNGFVNITPKNIFELYPQYTGFEQDINTYYNYCNSIATPTTCQQAFAGKEEQYTLISKIPNNVNDAKLYQYCHLELNYEDKNITTCVSSGAGTNQTIPIENIVEEIIKSDRGITLPGGTQQNGSGNITGDSIFTDIMDGENINITNVVESLQSVYNKLTGIFYRRNGVDGIIPDIIVRALLLVILFKIFKK